MAATSPLVFRLPGPIGDVMDRIRSRLDTWLGTPRRKQGQGRVTLLYRFESETPDAVPLKLKVEINTRELFCVYGIKARQLSMDNRWYQGSATLPTYCVEELLATKLRALYQRKKGRDLFDFFIAFQQLDPIDDDKIVAGFQTYIKQEG